MLIINITQILLMEEWEPQEIQVINKVQNYLDQVNFVIVCLIFIYLGWQMRIKMFDRNYVDRLSLMILALSFTVILIRFLF